MVPRWPPDGGGLALAAARLVKGLSAHLPVTVLVPGGTPGVVDHGAWQLVRVGASSREAVQRGLCDWAIAHGPWRLVHAVYPSVTGLPGVLAARHLSTPCLLAARGNDLDRDVFRPELQAGLLWAIAHADAVVGVSQALARRASALGARATSAIPNAVDPARFRPVPRDPALAAHFGLGTGPVVLFAGEARAKKGLATMRAAWPAIRAAHPDACLWLLGGVRPGEDVPDTPGLVITPAADAADMPHLYALADLAWHPSLADGVPNAVLEAMACGRATVGTPAGGIPDLLDTPDLRELLVPPADPAALVALTLALLADPARRQRLEAAGIARAAACSPEAEVAAYLTLYDTLAPKDA